MGNELALDVNVIGLLILGLFFVCIVTAFARPLVAGVSYVALWLDGLTNGRAEMRRAQAEALEAEAAPAVAEAEAAVAEAAVAEAAVAEAEAVIAAAQLRLFGEAGS